LPPEHREVLVLREIEEMGYREIAAVTNIPIGTVMSRLARARAAIKARCLTQVPGAPRAMP
jgi:RNA polymerase sigma-70 factor (ECF subfamily)